MFSHGTYDKPVQQLRLDTRKSFLMAISMNLRMSHGLREYREYDGTCCSSNLCKKKDSKVFSSRKYSHVWIYTITCTRYVQHICNKFPLQRSYGRYFFYNFFQKIGIRYIRRIICISVADFYWINYFFRSILTLKSLYDCNFYISCNLYAILMLINAFIILNFVFVI